MLEIYEEQMKKSLNNLEDKFKDLRAGRANPSILNKIMISYYGTMTPIIQVAGINVTEARVILVQPWDKSIIKEVEKSILEANLGVAVQNDGMAIRLIFPELTNERRVQLTKDVKEIAENAKVAIRNIRRDAIDDVKKKEKDSEISEDDLKRYEKDIQNLTDKYTKLIDEKYDAKVKEIMTV